MNKVLLDDDLMKDLMSSDEEDNYEQEYEDDQKQEQNNQQDNEELEYDENNQNGETQNYQNKEEINDALNEFKTTFKSQSKEVSLLLKDPNFNQFMEKVKVYIISKPKGFIDVDSEEYQMIKKANEYAQNVEREMQQVHKFVKDSYHKKFSELEKIVVNPIDYAKTVKLIGNKTNYNEIDFNGLLTSHQVLTITVAGSTFAGEQLSTKDLNQVINACDIILQLDEYQKLLLLFVETRMKYIGPNLSELLGTQCASKLMGAAGGIEALSRMPASNIQVMGSQKKALLGMSKANMGFNRGYFGQMEYVQNAPPAFQTRLVRMLATNSAKCARIDYMRTCPDGSAGKRIKELMLQRYDQIQKPQEGKLDKPLPPPDDKPKPKRGGKRFRKMKERLAMTEIRKYQNRLSFGTEAEDDWRGTGKGYGQLTNKVGQSSGKSKINMNKNQKLKLSKKQQQRLIQQNNADADGLSSSIAFTPVQGMELVNPSQRLANKRPENYFNKESGFKTVLEEKKKQSLAEKIGQGLLN
ncbi:hypothetical protein PPERSA_00022 [Pseudocohnilembus persalinus]|uniref:Nop domain-containing protein n=1 Tax=Pseudocohnilembus persalinus TaxID=266149 RepID=A0A0V0QV93_PSEPJ|nr:hypothetical protein PPERSA_00022 [Pseudocohnilembus persalinus]|eukprot:KRX06142.1 hypothetical protein PPERSA_00022 [Pseudocohnilembus persalinus]